MLSKEVKLWIVVGLGFALLCGAGIAAYNYAKYLSDKQIDAIVNASEKAGAAAANTKTLVENQKRFDQQLILINKRFDETNQSIADLRKENQKLRSTIEKFDARSVAKSDGVPAVEKWANDTNNGLFRSIETEANK